MNNSNCNKNEAGNNNKNRIGNKVKTKKSSGFDDNNSNKPPISMFDIRKENESFQYLFV